MSSPTQSTPANLPRGTWRHPQLAAWRRQATFRRSVNLLASFPQEQRDPEQFYRGLATDTYRLISSIEPDLAGRIVLDVGGGPGYFGAVFGDHGARYLAVEPDPQELTAAGISFTEAERGVTVRGSGLALPFADNSLDVTYSSNVAEHVVQPWVMGDEMVRVTAPGGLIVLSYTLWYGPFGGHEMGLTHYLGGDRARRLYERRHHHPPKNYYGRSLFKVLCRDGMTWGAQQPDCDLVGFFPRYHPRWAWWLVDVPGIREVLVSNLVIVLRKRCV